MLSVSDIRVSEAKRGRVPCRNEGEYRLLSEPGAEEICGVPSPNPCRSEENTVPLLYLCRQAPPSKPARKPSTKEPNGVPLPAQKSQTFNLRSHAQFC